MCPLLNLKRNNMYKLLRNLKLFDPFSIKYLIGNLNKRTYSI